MSAVCPAGHTSTSEDYCDVCGIPIEAAPSPAPAAAASPTPGGGGGRTCPNCATPNLADALFCEACGYDFTTDTMPRPLDPPTPAPPSPVSEAPEAATPLTAPAQDGAEATTAAPSAPPSISPTVDFDWVAEVWIDPAWYEAQESPDSLPSPGLPEVVPLRATSSLIGRVSRSRNIHPEIDCGGDSGVSRRQTQLTTDGSRWWVEDLESANGTFVGPASGALPTDPIPVGGKHELASDDRVYVGAWTRIVIRQATEDEQASL